VTPPVCAECLQNERAAWIEQQSTYEKANLYITLDGLDTPSTSSRGTRQSARKGKRSHVTVEMSSSNTVGDLKLSVAKALHFPVSYQMLFFHTACLDDDSSPLSSYHIPRDAVIRLLPLQESAAPDIESHVRTEDVTCFSDSAFFHQ
jgi:hypothetical protein